MKGVIDFFMGNILKHLEVDGKSFFSFFYLKTYDIKTKIN